MIVAIYQRRKAGRCANGAQRGAGGVIHLLPNTHSHTAALCETEPGRLSAGWVPVSDHGWVHGGRECRGCYSRVEWHLVSFTDGQPHLKAPTPWALDGVYLVKHLPRFPALRIEFRDGNDLDRHFTVSGGFTSTKKGERMTPKEVAAELRRMADDLEIWGAKE